MYMNMDMDMDSDVDTTEDEEDISFYNYSKIRKLQDLEDPYYNSRVISTNMKENTRCFGLFPNDISNIRCSGTTKKISFVYIILLESNKPQLYCGYTNFQSCYDETHYSFSIEDYNNIKHYFPLFVNNGEELEQICEKINSEENEENDENDKFLKMCSTILLCQSHFDELYECNFDLLGYIFTLLRYN